MPDAALSMPEEWRIELFNGVWEGLRDLYIDPDTIGSEPDPYVVIASVPGQREIERTTVTADRHEIQLDHWLPGAYHAEDFPIRFSVYDDDSVTADELIGVVDVTAAQIAAGGDFALELRSQGDVPQTMGSLRVTVAPVQ